MLQLPDPSFAPLSETGHPKHRRPEESGTVCLTCKEEGSSDFSEGLAGARLGSGHSTIQICYRSFQTFVNMKLHNE